MNLYPKLQLSILRQIGWDHWDPIGIRAAGSDTWQTHAADEYDSYLLHVVSLLHAGKSETEAVAYLDWVASEHMGLGQPFQTNDDAPARTVRAIADYLRTLPDGPLSVG